MSLRDISVKKHERTQKKGHGPIETIGSLPVWDVVNTHFRQGPWKFFMYIPTLTLPLAGQRGEAHVDGFRSHSPESPCAPSP